MLKDFLTNNEEEDFAMENASVMAAMLGEETDVALEGVSELAEKFKGKVSAIVEKIKNFIQKVVSWLKEKLFKLLKIDSIKIEQPMWNDAQTVLSLCDKVEIGMFGALISGVKVDKAQKDNNKEKINEIQDKIDASIEKVYSSEAYKKFMHGDYKDETMLTVKTSGLNRQKAKFHESLTQLEAAMKMLATQYKQESNAGLDPYGVTFAGHVGNSNIKVLNVRIEVLNKLLSKAVKTGVLVV